MQKDQYTMSDLHRVLFKAMDDLNAKKIGVHHANAIANLAMATIAAVRVECTYLDLLGGARSGMVPEETPKLPTQDQLHPVNRWKTRSA